jgi:inner membrane protein
MLACSGLSMLPDLDVIGVMMGVPDVGPCGHRGATHSLALPILVGLIAAALAPRWNLQRGRLAVICGLVVSSHLLLDAMTTASRGVPLLWPISFHRFALPWRPIPNAPCGLEYLSTAGLRVASIELVLFLPLLLVALWPARSVRRPGAPPAHGARTGGVRPTDRLAA